jgi:anaerobic glycerol-3-phosphate dehydrogenase
MIETPDQTPTIETPDQTSALQKIQSPLLNRRHHQQIMEILTQTLQVRPTAVGMPALSGSAVADAQLERVGWKDLNSKKTLIPTPAPSVRHLRQTLALPRNVQR